MYPVVHDLLLPQSLPEFDSQMQGKWYNYIIFIKPNIIKRPIFIFCENACFKAFITEVDFIWFSTSPRKWQKLPGCEFLRLGQIWNPEHFYSCSRQICHRHKAKASLRHSWYLSDWSAFRFLCGCAPCNCIKTRMFSAHSNLFLYSICMNKEKVGYIEITHCQSGSMVLFPAIRRNSVIPARKMLVQEYWLNELTPMRVLKVPVKIMFLP
mgnify:CR=1 FL=1